jgi:dipeptidyl aminopeptidase/acylaminoacyl peptidase
MKKLFLLIILVLFTACAPGPVEPTPGLENGNNVPETVAIIATPARDQPNPFSVEVLRANTYGKGELSVEYAWENQPEFTRYYITYPSDDLTIHGFINIPVGKGPFPIIIALHGYIPPSEYKTRDYSTRYADALAQNGYIVLHPNMRGFPPSTSIPRRGDSLTGYTTDVLNLIALVRRQAGKEGIFKNADFSRMGIWGHSLGGGVALRVLSILPEIKAAVIYASVSQRYSNASTGYTVYDLAGSSAAFSLHHGEEDKTVPPSWTKALNQQLLDLGKKVEYFTYPGQPHTFYGQSDTLFIRRMVDFFFKYLKSE